MTPHKHAALIKAWADGANIQLRLNSDWIDIYPMWRSDEEYRVKPDQAPDIVRFMIIDKNFVQTNERFFGANICLIFDSKTGVLKKAEVI